MRPMTHFSLDLPVQARYDFQKNKKLRSDMYLGPLGDDAVRSRRIRQAICPHEVEDANT